MTKKNVSKNNYKSYKRNKRNKRNTHCNIRISTRKKTRLKKYNIKTQNAGSNAHATTGKNSNIKRNTNSNNINKHILENRLMHVWYRNWPDNGVPTNMEDFYLFINKLYDDIYNNINFFKLEEDDAIIIHCNSGAGSSGIVLIILQLKQLKDEYRKIITEQIILNEIIEARTKYRMSLVHTLEQFMFICKFFSINEDDDVMKKYKEKLVSYKSLQKGESEPQFDPQSYITKTHAPKSSLVAQGSQTTEYAILQKNKDSQTHSNPNNNRVKLKVSGEQNNDYINASIMQPITINNKQIKMILAQGPTLATVQHFLQMCVDNKVRLIIMLTGLTKGDEENCADYMESAGDFSLLNININKKYDNKADILYTEYNINILKNNKGEYSSTGTSTNTQRQLIEQEQEQKRQNAKLLEQEQKQQLYKDTITKLSNIDKNIRLKVLEYLNTLNSTKNNTINVEIFNTFMFENNLFIKISANSNPNEEKKELNEGIKNGRQYLLDLLKNPLQAILYNIDLNVKNQIIKHIEEQLKAHIDTDANIDKFNKTKKHEQIISKEDIDLFTTFIDELYTKILQSQEDQLTLNNALTTYGLTELIAIFKQSNNSAPLP